MIFGGVAPKPHRRTEKVKVEVKADVDGNGNGEGDGLTEREQDVQAEPLVELGRDDGG